MLQGRHDMSKTTDLQPGPELDALVAEKILGCNVVWIGPHPYCDCTDPNPEAPGPHMVQEMGGTQRFVQPSTRIQDAWEVVKELRRKRFSFCAAVYGEIGTSGALFRGPIAPDRRPTSYCFGQAGKDGVGLMPHAICLAALKAVKT